MRQTLTQRQIIGALRNLIYKNPSFVESGMTLLREFEAGRPLAGEDTPLNDDGLGRPREPHLAAIAALNHLYRRGAVAPFSAAEADQAVVVLLLALDPDCETLPIPCAQRTNWDMGKALDPHTAEVRSNRAAWLTWVSAHGRGKQVSHTTATRAFLGHARAVLQVLDAPPAEQGPAPAQRVLRPQEQRVISTLRKHDRRMTLEKLAFAAFGKPANGHSRPLITGMRSEGLLTNHRSAPDTRGKGYGLPEWE